MKLSLINVIEESFNWSLDFRWDGTQLRVSQKFWDWIKCAEGSPKKKCEAMLVGYKDSVGIPTIGYGHTGPEVKVGMKIDNNQALKYLYADATVAADCVRRLLKEWKNGKFPGYRLKQHEFDALVSLVYNSGCNGVRKSEFVKYLKKGDYVNAGKNILNHKNKGLSNRRRAEYEIFVNKNYLKV